MIISVVKELLRDTIIAHCSACKMSTLHFLSESKKYYHCGCGEVLQVELEDKDE